jgi:dienelactone hydrolase
LRENGVVVLAPDRFELEEDAEQDIAQAEPVAMQRRGTRPRGRAQVDERYNQIQAWLADEALGHRKRIEELIQIRDGIE